MRIPPVKKKGPKGKKQKRHAPGSYPYPNPNKAPDRQVETHPEPVVTYVVVGPEADTEAKDGAPARAAGAAEARTRKKARKWRMAGWQRCRIRGELAILRNGR